MERRKQGGKSCISFEGESRLRRWAFYGSIYDSDAICEVLLLSVVYPTPIKALPCVFLCFAALLRSEAI